jgi:hypothetical protein
MWFLLPRFFLQARTFVVIERYGHAEIGANDP